MSVKYLLQQMLFTVWSFLSAAGLVRQEEIGEIWKMDPREFENEAYNISSYFNQSLNRDINLNHEDQSDIVWHLGISKEIMKFIMGYKQSLSA